MREVYLWVTSGRSARACRARGGTVSRIACALGAGGIRFGRRFLFHGGARERGVVGDQMGLRSMEAIDLFMLNDNKLVHYDSIDHYMRDWLAAVQIDFHRLRQETAYTNVQFITDNSRFFMMTKAQREQHLKTIGEPLFLLDVTIGDATIVSDYSDPIPRCIIDTILQQLSPEPVENSMD